MTEENNEDKKVKLAKPDSLAFRAYLVQKKRKKRNAEEVVA